MSDIKCYFLEPTNRYRRRLRRYTWRDKVAVPPCPLRRDQPFHDASALLDVVEALEHPTSGDTWPHDDARWPLACGCGYRFTAEAEWQLFVDQIYHCAETGEDTTLRDARPGAMWYADWYHTLWPGPDGHTLVVKTPGGDWIVDSEASNCTRKGESHHCWIRHGVPPIITVDKDGDTCAAGAGSIQAGAYHGFLRNGVLQEC